MTRCRVRCGPALVASALLASALLAGCFETTLYSGRPPGDVPPSHDRRWHHAFLLGAAEASGPYDLSRICPTGWSEVHGEADALQTFLAIFTIGIYTPQSVTIVCAAGPDAARQPPDPLAGVERP